MSVSLTERINFTPEPVLVLQPGEWKIIAVNSAFANSTGFDLEELLQKTVLDLFESSIQNKLSLYLQKNGASFGRGDFLLELPNVHGKAGKFSFVSSLQVYENSSYLFLWFHAQDPSSQSAGSSSYQELSHLARLADIGRLSAGIAHELNNPLMIVQGYAENIDFAIQSSPINIEDIQSSVRQIMKSVARMSKIITGVKRFVRNEDLCFSKSDLAEIVQGSITFLERQINAQEVHLENDSDTTSVVMCDPSQIEQIITNIMSNAIHALKDQPGERKLKVSFSETEGHRSVHIWNNGPPIPAEIREKVFNPFFTTKRAGEGTGLGLSISYGIMKAHNGDLSFISEEGKGTCFTLEFPRVVSKSDGLHVEGKILVVDDEEAFCWLLGNKLKQFGLEVIASSSWKEALAIMRSEPDLIGAFIDYRMPDVDGIELVKMIRAEFGTKHLICLATGYPMSYSDENKIKSSGVDDFITKPFDMDQLTQVVDKIAAHKNSPRFMEGQKKRNKKIA